MRFLLLSAVLLLASPEQPVARQVDPQPEPCYWSIIELAPHPEHPSQWRMVRSHLANSWQRVIMAVNAIKHSGGTARVEKICGWSGLTGI